MAHPQHGYDTPELRLRRLTECPPPHGTYPICRIKCGEHCDRWRNRGQRNGYEWPNQVAFTECGIRYSDSNNRESAWQWSL